MDNFLIDILFDNCSGNYVARMSSGDDVTLNADTYEDAVIEADAVAYS
jgi:hypothetical protein|tara:strand:- start:588 stop:731 length:144 start_codon:yes stop_codon:yes gene_type:complete